MTLLSGSGRDREAILPLVIGLGNEFRGDDGCGLAVARSIREPGDPRFRVVEFDGDVAGLLEVWEGGELVVVVDAMRSGRAPGTVERWEVGEEPLPSPLGSTSTHGLSLAQGVALGQSLDRLPRRLVVYGIEAATFDRGAGLTPAVSTSVIQVAERIRREISAEPTGAKSTAEGGSRA